MDDLSRVKKDDPFLLQYQPSDLRIASEFLTTWLPFLSRDLCHRCTETLSLRICSLDSEFDGKDRKRIPSSSLANDDENCCDKNSTGSGSNSFGSWKDGVNGRAESVSISIEASTSGNGMLGESPSNRTPHISWADMAQEDELVEEEEQHLRELHKPVVDLSASMGELRVPKVVVEKPTLPREQREYIRFMNVKRRKDFICFERSKGKLVNILEGLELHMGIFSAAEQKRIVDYVYVLQEMGRKGELRERTYSAPKRWMKGKGRETVQFGCCYNYAVDKYGNAPGILQNESVDPIPPLFKVIIRRLIRWHVLPPTCVPDSCIVNIYEEGDCIPPHIDNHDFLRPFCTVSFLNECNIVFGSNIKVMGPGEFAGSIAIPLPVGSVLVLNGNGADISKHCVPSVPAKRISITFRKMDETKRPIGFVPESDLQDIQQMLYEMDKTMKSDSPKSEPYFKRFASGKEKKMEVRGISEYGSHSEPRNSTWSQRGPANRRRTNVDIVS